jgi:tape measure domain-containing protein
MENINGALGFEATLDINDFKVSADAMDRHIRQVSTNVQMEADAMEQSMLDFAQKGAMYIQAYLVGQGMTGLLQSIVQVRGQFQQLEIAFTTMLGSEEKASALMNQMIQTAARTPFDLAGVAGGAKQLLAYGESAEKVNDTLVRLGNIASGLSIPLNDIVYLYGTTMVQGRLYAQDVRQFTGRGIPLVKELAAMYGVTADKINDMVSAGKIGFADVEKVINKLTDSGGQFYNLMEKQSASLTGMISNLEDAWDSMLNNIGKENQDTLADAISSATYLVEHYQDILDILKAVAIAYGSVKAAVVLNTLATKGYTGIALIDNTARQAKIALMRAEAVATGQLSAQQQAMTMTQEAYVASLEKELTAEELSNLRKKLRIATIQGLLTAQQAEYLSNLGLTTSSQNYEAAAMQVLTVDQKQALQKLDLSSKSAIYRAALDQEVLAKRSASQAAREQAQAELEAMRVEVSAASKRMEATKAQAVAAMQRTEAARYELYWAKQSGNASAIAAAQKKLEAAEDNQAIARKTALAASTDFYTKKKTLEITATKGATAASVADTTAKGVQTTATNLLSVATGKATLALKTLWLTMKANPIGWLITLIGMGISAFTLFSGKEEETEEKAGTLANAMKKSSEEFSNQASKVDSLRKMIEDGNLAYDERKKKLDELKAIIPDYNAEITKEGQIINNNTEAIEKYLVALEKQIKLKAAQDELTEAYKQKRQLEKTERTQSDAYWNTRQSNTAQGYDRNGIVAKTLRLFGAETETNQEKALNDTRQQLSEVNSTISELTKEINQSAVATAGSTEKIKTYKEQVADAEAKVKKLNQEIADMRAGKVVDENLAKAIADKQKELQQASSELAALTGKKVKGGSTSTDNSAKTLAEKQLEAQRKLEEARVSVMEESYAKRKAALALQHQENLDRINKEEKELEAAYKKSGKGKMSDTEKAGFQERRNLENKAYDQESTKLFDGEIEYKKRQYEAYFKWVENVGKDVADSHFKTLIADGSSFINWVNTQISQLEAKKQSSPDSFTDGDANALNALKIQMDELAGTKSSLDTFKETLADNIRRAQTLAEKIQAVADLRDRLSKGEFHLTGDDKAGANYALNQQDSDLQKEVQDKILVEYRTFEEKRKSIHDEYAMLMIEAQKQNDQNRIRMIQEAENEALSALNASELMQSESWKNLFSDLDSLTVSEIDKLIHDIQTRMNTADLKMNPADMKAVLDKLDEAKKKVLDTNPFKALGSALSNVFKKTEKDSKKSKKQIQVDWTDLAKATEGCFDFVQDAIDSCEVLGDVIGDTGKAMISTLSGIATAGIAMAQAIKTAEKGSVILAAISIALQAIQFIAGLFNNDAELEDRIQDLQRYIDGLEGSLQRLQHSYDKTFWAFSEDEEKAYRKRRKEIEDQIQILQSRLKPAMALFNYGEYDAITKKIKELNYELEKVSRQGDMFDLMELQKENLREQQEMIRRQIEAEKEKKDTDYDKIAQWEEKIKDIDTQIEDLGYSMMETLAGTDVKSAISDFADLLIEAYDQGIDAAEALGKKTKEVLRNAVIEALKRQFLAKGINDAVEYLGSAMEDSNLTEQEREHFTSMVNEAGSVFSNALNSIGDWIRNTEDAAGDALTGAVQGMSEETGGLVAGRLNAVVINQGEMIEMTRQMLLYHAAIEQNTANTVTELREIKAYIRMSNSGNTLLSQGIS